MKIKKTYVLKPDAQEHGMLLWFSLLYSHMRELFLANLILLISLLPASYMALVFIESKNLVFQLFFIVLMGLAGIGLTVFSGCICRICLRRPVWLWVDLKAVLKKDLLKAVLLGMLTGLIWSVIYDAAIMLYASVEAVSLPLLLLAVLYIFLATGFTFFSFQQLAMIEISLGRVIVNGFLLIFAGNWRSLAAILNIILVIGVCLYYYGIGSVLIIAGLPAVAFMSSALIFTPLFKQIFLEDK